MFVIVGLAWLFFVPLYPTDLLCPSTVSYCSETEGDYFTLIEYIIAAQP